MMKPPFVNAAPPPNPLPEREGNSSASTANDPLPTPHSPSIAIVGGGLAGLAAAVAAVQAGFGVELFEARRRLGGRAGSFRDPQSGHWIDQCQHIAMGCCTAWIDFCRRTHIEDCFCRQPQLHFIGPDGGDYRLRASPLLPAPWHLGPALARLAYLSWKERWRIARAMGQLARSPLDDDQETIAAWLRRHGQSDRAIEQFWSVILTSALGETPERASRAAARKVFVDGFLGSRRAYELYLPRLALDEVYNRRIAAWLAAHGVIAHLGTRVKRIEGDGLRASELVLAGGTRRRFDGYVVAVPWRQVRGLMSESLLGGLPGLASVDQIEPSPITAVHLWFDRSITRLGEAVLVGRLSQWIFRRSGNDPEEAACGHYYQVVISGSRDLADCDRREVVRRVCGELAALWPAARQARLLRSRVVTNPQAVFSMRPGIQRLRPPQATPVENLALAGDWTSTGWPATMEGAVRSGYLAVAALVSGGQWTVSRG